MTTPTSLGNAPIGEEIQARMCFDEPLARHTSFRIGGPADFFVTAKTEEELVALLALAGSRGLDHFVLGSGSNILVSDLGVRGLVILNRTSAHEFTTGPEGVSRVCAASGVLLDHLARESASSGLAGLEWAVGIPGTVGGAVVQNAGAFGSSLADVLLEVRVASPRVAGKRLCTIRTSSPDDLSLGYRTSRFRRPDGRPSTEVILSVCLQLCSRPREELCQCMTRYRQSRRAAQPWLPNAGSVFKNPPGDYAARLIEGAGLKGARHGDAMVAPEHANFIVNLGSARASDVKCLMNHVRATVDQEFGVNLEPEIQLVGEWHGSCR